MSRVYFTSPSGEAELHGSERAWLDHVSSQPAISAYDINYDSTTSGELRKIGRLLELVDQDDELHALYRAAKAEDDLYRESWKGKTFSNPGRMPNNQPMNDLVRSLKFSVIKPFMSDQTFRLDDMVLYASSVARNTALVAGSDPIKLAAKIHCYCEIHAYVEGQHRNWFADIIDQGLNAGIFRRELRYQSMPDSEYKLSNQGWESVQKLLRERDDEPVVMSYSVTDSFPNPRVAGWKDEQDGDKFYDLPEAEQWDRAFAGLSDTPWLSISPETLGGCFFESPITVYDLLAADRDDRIHAKYEIKEVAS